MSDNDYWRRLYTGLAMQGLMQHQEYFIGQEQDAIDIADGLLAALETVVDRQSPLSYTPEISAPGKEAWETVVAMNRLKAAEMGIEPPEYPHDYDAVKGWPDVLTDRQIEREIEQQEKEAVVNKEKK